jgi:hypothetical protein
MVAELTRFVTDAVTGYLATEPTQIEPVVAQDRGRAP